MMGNDRKYQRAQNSMADEKKWSANELLVLEGSHTYIYMHVCVLVHLADRGPNCAFYFVN